MTKLGWEEALKALKEGKKVRRSNMGWTQLGRVLRMQGEEPVMVQQNQVMPYFKRGEPPRGDMMAKDWEIVE